MGISHLRVRLDEGVLWGYYSLMSKVRRGCTYCWYYSPLSEIRRWYTVDITHLWQWLSNGTLWISLTHYELDIVDFAKPRLHYGTLKKRLHTHLWVRLDDGTLWRLWWKSPPLRLRFRCRSSNRRAMKFILKRGKISILKKSKPSYIE